MNQIKRYHCSDEGLDPLTQPCPRKFNKKETFIKHLERAHKFYLVKRLNTLAKLNHIDNIATFLMTGGAV